MKVTEIATRLGIHSKSRFVQDFKKAHGMTPTEYRKLHKRHERQINEEGTERHDRR